MLFWPARVSVPTADVPTMRKTALFTLTEGGGAATGRWGLSLVHISCRLVNLPGVPAHLLGGSLSEGSISLSADAVKATAWPW